MNEDAKKTTLRMIPYGLYVLTADDGDGNVAASTVNWVTQSAFSPPLVVVGVKTDSHPYELITKTRKFALNVLGKGQNDMAYTFFKAAKLEGGKLNGYAIHKGTTGSPLFDDAVGALECEVTTIVEEGDHHVVLGRVVEAHLPNPPAGRIDAGTLTLGDLGEKVYYGG